MEIDEDWKRKVAALRASNAPFTGEHTKRLWRLSIVNAKMRSS
jgi:hypothetical protein